jgi:Tube Death domain
MNHFTEFLCCISRLIEKAGSAEKTCSEYLIDEWGTSTNGEPGNFPKIGDLIRFLVGAGLYIPAVYLAIDLLHDESLIVRPSFGPAALVDTTMQNPSTMDRIVADAEYPDNFENINDSVLNRNLDHQQSLTSRNLSIPMASPEPELQPVIEPMSVSLVIPSLDSLLSPNSGRLPSEPMLSDLLASSSSSVSSEVDSEPVSFNIPDMEVLNEPVSQISEPIIPNLSILGNDG